MADDPRPLASLSLTHVHYDPTDPVSYLCAWLALMPQGLCVVYVTLIWSTREIEVALLFAGQLACEALNFVLKRILKQERPVVMHGKGYGMPSSHAQFTAFFAVSMCLFLLVRHQPPTPGVSRRNHTPMTVPERALGGFLCLLMAAAVAWSRTYLSYHTELQVLVGSAAGVVSAVSWFLITEIARRTGWVAWLVDSPPARWLRVRDLCLEEDLCQAGWEKWDDRQWAALQVQNSKKKA
ncbi:dolichyldiphosphatase [Microdochium nivale]|nr:dolichyldiphosphatase [Microdochium nivale]